MYSANYNRKDKTHINFKQSNMFTDKNIEKFETEKVKQNSVCTVLQEKASIKRRI